MNERGYKERWRQIVFSTTLLVVGLASLSGAKAQSMADNPFAGPCWNSEDVIKIATDGAYWDKSEGVYLLAFGSSSSSKTCNYPNGSQVAQDCKVSKGEKGDPIVFMLDPKKKTYVISAGLDGGGEEILDAVTCCGPLYKDSGDILKPELAGEWWKKPRLKKLKPCPVSLAGTSLLYTQAQGQVELSSKLGSGYDELSPNCFQGQQGELILRVRMKSRAINGDSSRCDSSSVLAQGWAYVVVDAANFNPAWQNTLGLRALGKKKYEQAQAHFQSALKSDPAYRHANYNLACTLSLTKTPFAQGQKHLQRILEQSELRSRYLKKIKKDKDLQFWRADPAFGPWLTKFK